MTKNEILYGGKISDEQVFEKDVADLLLSLRSLSVRVSCGMHNSGIWSFHQRQKLERFVRELEILQVEIRRWSFHGEKDQLNLPLDK